MKLDRRQILLGSAGAAAGLVLPGGAAWAQTPASIGTFPDGVTADSVFVGLTIPLTGVFSGDGGDLKLGYELAISEINAGGDAAKKWG
jgi:ABC-type branched-subunit amino acid transport system substrate-binding protein